MTTFVLVPGAWLGGFAWERVSSAILDAGHDVRPVTLPGLGNRSDETGVGLQDHVDDLVALVEGADLRDIVLVGHSYAGLPVGIAALALRDRIRRLVLVDSAVPLDGEPLATPTMRAEIEAHQGWWPPPGHDGFAGQDLAHEDIHFFEDWSKPHPGATLTDAPRVDGDLATLPTTYVLCLKHAATPDPAVAALLASPRWRLVELDTGHWPMWSAPAQLAAVLLDAALLEAT